MERNDPNSTYQVLTGLPDSLKPRSPSSLNDTETQINRTNVTPDEGEQEASVDLSLVLSASDSTKGKLIEAAENLRNNILAVLNGE
ncbi:hypothetical protein [Brevibacillus sp. NRS-1366]|uniref:hypothetical protein n=1 Tax=Brevibacillus sp. NRS-1366 TaxID=3233899 RepID=UPI003D202D82